MNYKDGIKQVFDEAFRQSNAGIDNQHLIVGTILTVDETLGLCSVQPIDQNTTIIDNVLISSADDAKPIFIPSIGTTVTVSLYDKESACVVGYGATTKVNLNAGEEDYGGLIKIEDLVDKINNLEDKVNNLCNWIAQIVTNYNAHTHTITSPGNPSGPATPLETKTSEPTLTKTTVDDIENPTVTHGDGIKDKSSYISDVKAALAALEAAQNNFSKAVSSGASAAQLASLQKILNQKQANYNNLINNPE